MHRYIIKRLLLMIPVIIGVSFLVFFIMDLAPGDAVDILAPEGATAEDLEAIRHDLGLDQPVIVRYVKYMGGMFPMYQRLMYSIHTWKSSRQRSSFHLHRSWFRSCCRYHWEFIQLPGRERSRIISV